MTATQFWESTPDSLKIQLGISVGISDASELFCPFNTLPTALKVAIYDSSDLWLQREKESDLAAERQLGEVNL